jgi:hypothetical protein
MSKPRPNFLCAGRVGDRKQVQKCATPSQIRPIPRRGLSRIEAAIYVGVSPSKFDEFRKDGRIRPPRLVDGRKVWDIHDLDRDFEACPVEGGDDLEDWDARL